MFRMTTKTLTIMEDAYDLLADNKLEGESFSDEIRRVLSRKQSRPLTDFFGILSEEQGKKMLDDLEKIKASEISMLRGRLK
jgi:predicted CopG family antitoxin